MEKQSSVYPEQQIEEKYKKPLTFKEALKDIVEIGGPQIFSMVLCLFIEVLNSAFVGHLGKEEVMAGVGMANMFINVACLSLLFGMNMVLNTLASQAKGYGNLRLCGIFLNQSRIIVTLIFFPICIVMFNADFLFELVGFDKQASQYSQQYINPMLPGMLFNALSDSNRRFLNTLDYQNGPMIIQLIATVFHCGWCYLFTMKLEMSAQGTGIATTLTFFSIFVGMHIYSERCMSPEQKKQAWFSPFRADVRIECFDKKGLIDYFKLGIPSTGMLCLEWWSFEIMTVFAAYISLSATASQVIMMNMAALFFMPSLGLQTAGSILVGQRIGAHDVVNAKQYQKIIQIVGASIAFFTGLIIYFGAELIIEFYTNIKEVQIGTLPSMRYLAIFHQIDSMQGVASGILRGIGKTTHASIGGAISYWLISLPMEYLFGIKYGYGVIGLWYGQSFGAVTHCSIQMYLVLFHFGDWVTLSSEARQKLKEEENRLNDIKTSSNQQSESKQNLLQLAEIKSNNEP